MLVLWHLRSKLSIIIVLIISCNDFNAENWMQYFRLKNNKISRINRTNGGFLMNNSIIFWYFLIFRKTGFTFRNQYNKYIHRRWVFLRFRILGRDRLFATIDFVRKRTVFGRNCLKNVEKIGKNFGFIYLFTFN